MNEVGLKETEALIRKTKKGVYDDHPDEQDEQDLKDVFGDEIFNAIMKGSTPSRP